MPLLGISYFLIGGYLGYHGYQFLVSFWFCFGMIVVSFWHRSGIVLLSLWHHFGID